MLSQFETGLAEIVGNLFDHLQFGEFNAPLFQNALRTIKRTTSGHRVSFLGVRGGIGVAGKLLNDGGAVGEDSAAMGQRPEGLHAALCKETERLSSSSNG